jgi:hypothetical protein
MSAASPSRTPLAWPQGWPRCTDLQSARFKAHGRDITISAAMDRLERELERLGATDGFLSSNLKLGLSGVPLSGQAEPRDRGVAVYFKLDGADRVLACDRYLSCAGNIAAIANHIDALRRIDRYGVGTLQQAFAGYTGLPPPSADNRPPWRSTLGFKPHTTVTAEDVKVNFRTLAKQAATDENRLRDLNLARDAALRELGMN